MRTAAMDATLRRIAIDAGRAIMEVYGAEDIGLAAKADASPVTAADLAADAIIRAGLRAAFPDVAVVTEEHAASHAGDAGPRYFLVDPLDGTREFVRRQGDFTVNIALIEHGLPVAGVVYAPAKARLFRSVAGGGAVEETGILDRDAEGPVRAITVARPDNAALRVVASKSHRDAATDAYIARYAVAAFKGAGSSLKFCLLAAGEADLYPRLGRTMEWDTAAGQAVLMAAGGAVVRADDLRPLTYGKPGRENPHFIAFVPGVVLKAG